MVGSLPKLCALERALRDLTTLPNIRRGWPICQCHDSLERFKVLSGEARLAQFSAQQQFDHEWRDAHSRLRKGIPIDKTAAIKCPVCGGEMLGCAPLSALSLIQMSRLKRRILDAVIKAYPRPLRRDYLVDVMYADAPHGGPASAHGCFYVLVHRINIQLKQAGWKIGALRSYNAEVVLHPLHAKR